MRGSERFHRIPLIPRNLTIFHPQGSASQGNGPLENPEPANASLPRRLMPVTKTSIDASLRQVAASHPPREIHRSVPHMIDDQLVLKRMASKGTAGCLLPARQPPSDSFTVYRRSAQIRGDNATSANCSSAYL